MGGQESILASIVLLLWSAFCVQLPLRLSAPRAVAIGLIGGALLLPRKVGWDFPLLPPLTSSSLPPLCLAIGLFLGRRSLILRHLPATGFDIWFALLCCASLATALTNPIPIVYEREVIEGLTPYDAISQASSVILGWWMPYYLGRVAFRKGEHLYILLQFLVMAALAYSVLALYELRFSPQLHRMLYGFHQHSFTQVLRGDGYRPMIFMSHGLTVAHFFFGTALLAFTLARYRLRVFGHPALLAGAYLAGLLASLKSLGALLLGVVAIPLMWLTRPILQVWISIFISLIVAFYFVGRATDVIPAEEIVAKVATYSEQRASSLRTRVVNENALLLKALERPIFGWGHRGRSRIYDETGRDITTSDGLWIIVIGREGAVGVTCRLLALTAPFFMLVWRRKELGARSFGLLAGVVVFVAFSAFDMILNAATVTPLTLLLAGSVAGCVEGAAEAPARRARRRRVRPGPEAAAPVEQAPPRGNRPHPLLR